MNKTNLIMAVAAFALAIAKYASRMKKSFLIAALTLTAIGSGFAQARLGNSVAQVEKEFGKRRLICLY